MTPDDPRETHRMPPAPTQPLEQVRFLLCDADGNLFPSEEPAFDASVEVTNAFLAEIGSDRRFTAPELRLVATGLNFRSTARRLAVEAGVPDVDVEPWVQEEKRAVTAHLARTLRPHPPTSAALEALAAHLTLAAVSSSALARAGGTDPRPLLGVRSIFGDLGEDPVFVAELADALDRLERDGARLTVAASLHPSARFRA